MLWIYSVINIQISNLIVDLHIVLQVPSISVIFRPFNISSRTRKRILSFLLYFTAGRTETITAFRWTRRWASWRWTSSISSFRPELPLLWALKCASSLPLLEMVWHLKCCFAVFDKLSRSNFSNNHTNYLQLYLEYNYICILYVYIYIYIYLYIYIYIYIYCTHTRTTHTHTRTLWWINVLKFLIQIQFIMLTIYLWTFFAFI